MLEDLSPIFVWSQMLSSQHPLLMICKNRVMWMSLSLHLLSVLSSVACIVSRCPQQKRLESIISISGCFSGEQWPSLSRHRKPALATSSLFSFLLSGTWWISLCRSLAVCVRVDQYQILSAIFITLSTALLISFEELRCDTQNPPISILRFAWKLSMQIF